MVEERGELSVEMRRFISLQIARPFIYRFLVILLVYELFIVGGVIALMSLEKGFLFVMIAIILGCFGGVVIYQNSPLLRVPLAVNLNHPFMGDLELGEAVVMVQYSDGNWGDVGKGRVRLTVDELMGGTLLIRDDDTYAVLGHFSSLPQTHPALKRYVILINQAIALRDAVNGDEDSIESAREREASDSGLLQRSWLEEQESIEIEPEGIFSKLRRE